MVLGQAQQQEFDAMIRVTVSYPAQENARFDHSYYQQHHAQLIHQQLDAPRDLGDQHVQAQIPVHVADGHRVARTRQGRVGLRGDVGHGPLRRALEELVGPVGHADVGVQAHVVVEVGVCPGNGAPTPQTEDGSNAKQQARLHSSSPHSSRTAQ